MMVSRKRYQRWSLWLCLCSILGGCWLALPAVGEARAFRASRRNYARQRSRVPRAYKRAKRKRKYVPCRAIDRLTALKSRLEGYLGPGGMRGSRYWKRKHTRLFGRYVKLCNKWINYLAGACEKRKEYLKWSRQITQGYSSAVSNRKRAPCKSNAKLRRYRMLLEPDNAANWSSLPRKQRRSLGRLQRKYRGYTARRLRSSQAGCRAKYGSGYKAKIAQELAALQTPAPARRAIVTPPIRRTPTPMNPATTLTPGQPARQPPPAIVLPTTPRTRQAPPTRQPPRQVAVVEDPKGMGVSRKVKPALTRIDQPLFLSAGVKFFSRRFFYSDDLFGVLRPYNLLMAPALQVDGRWYPLAHFMRGFPAHIGVIGQFYYALGLGSRTPEGNILATTAMGFHVGLTGRIPVGPVAIRLSGSYGQQIFAIGQEAPKSVPDVAYQWVRLALGLRWLISERFALTTSFAYLVVLEAGEMWSDNFFPHASVGGIDANMGLSWSALKFLDVRFGVRMQYYFHAMNSEPGDRRVAGGAADQYLNFELGLTLRL